MTVYELFYKKLFQKRGLNPTPSFSGKLVDHFLRAISVKSTLGAPRLCGACGKGQGQGQHILQEVPSSEGLQAVALLLPPAAQP